jgi:choline dehydrogenase-like flavoprotein
MDHPYYVPWGLLPETATPVWPYRGPLSTSGIESARDGEFRSRQAAFRVDIGNEGWNFVVGGMGGDPSVTTADFINGTNVSGANDRGPGGKPEVLFGRELVKRLNSILTRQVRLGFLVEQTPDESNRVTVPDPASVKPAECDHLGLPRPHIHYDLSDYTKRGLAAAKVAGDQILQALGATQLTAEVKRKDADPCAFEWPQESGNFIRYYGAGHIVGTYRMGSDRTKSVVDSELRSWDHKNLYLAGSGVFPTIATANPTLTLAALALRLAETIKQALA